MISLAGTIDNKSPPHPLHTQKDLPKPAVGSAEAPNIDKPQQIGKAPIGCNSPLIHLGVQGNKGECQMVPHNPIKIHIIYKLLVMRLIHSPL